MLFWVLGWCSLFLPFKLLSHFLLCILICYKLDATGLGLALDTQVKSDTPRREGSSVSKSIPSMWKTTGACSSALWEPQKWPRELVNSPEDLEELI